MTLAFAITSGSYVKIVPYWTAQVLGAFCGATLVWLYFLPHWSMTEDKDAKLAVFCTAPAIRHYPGNLFCEVIGTMLLIVVVAAIGSKALAPTGLTSGTGPYFVSILVWAIGLSLGGTTGYAINPARDFGPRCGACDIAGGWEGKLRLGVCANPSGGAFARCGAGCGNHQGSRNFLRRLQPSPQESQNYGTTFDDTR